MEVHAKNKWRQKKPNLIICVYIDMHFSPTDNSTIKTFNLFRHIVDLPGILHRWFHICQLNVIHFVKHFIFRVCVSWFQRKEKSSRSAMTAIKTTTPNGTHNDMRERNFIGKAASQMNRIYWYSVNKNCGPFENESSVCVSVCASVYLLSIYSLSLYHLRLV